MKKRNRYIVKQISTSIVIFILSTGFISTSSRQTTQQQVCTHNEENTNRILYPLSVFPVFVEKEKNFTIDFQTNGFDNLYASISTAYEPIVDEIDLEIKNIWKTDAVWHANVSIPADTPEELYNLTLILEKNDTYFSYTQPRAVSVVERFSSSFSFIHISDLHVGDFRGAIENFKETIRWRSIRKCIEEVNLLHPDFVLITGDLVFGQLYPFEYQREYRRCFELLQRFDVPTFICPGNHDGYNRLGEDGFDFWEKYFGPLFYSFDYGSYHFSAVNTYDWPSKDRRAFWFIPLNWGGYISDDQLKWINQDLADKNMSFVFLHHNPLWETKESLTGKQYYNREKLLSLIERHDVDMVLAGHSHYDNVTFVNETIYVTTTTPASNTGSVDAYWGYRFIEIINGEIVSFNYKEPKYSIPTYRLNHTYVDPYAAVVENDLEKDINVLLKFLVPTGEYQVENGEILMKREKNKLAEIYVIAPIERESEVKVTLSPP
jgi:3',5'-cyclic AMP phosphodiesterase CpdA